MADPVIHSLSPADNIRAAYHTLNGRVTTALRTQLGDAIRLQETRTQALALLEAAEHVSSPTTNTL